MAKPLQKHSVQNTLAITMEAGGLDGLRTGDLGGWSSCRFPAWDANLRHGLSICGMSCPAGEHCLSLEAETLER